MDKGTKSFPTRLKEAFSNRQMRKSVPITQDNLRFARRRAFDELGHSEDWRELASQIRMQTLDHLQEHLSLLAENIERNGGFPHFAADGEEAVEVILRIVKEHGAKSVVKSKSMVTEEIHLNPVLEQEGIKVVETDLGEFIIQLAGETPSHILAPAIHKSRQEIAELFSRESGQPLSDQTEELTGYARRRLREEFLEADVGITGCNFAVAESGSVILISNEGNARMSSTLPKVHIVVMGMERIVPTWEELDVLVTMLTRSATGQKLSVYMTAISGPRREGDLDGPEEFHVVIVDNGRSRILGTKYKEILKCIRCSACVNVCPVYREIGGHAYGSVYSGPIGAVLTPLLDGMEKHKELPYLSSLCGACTEVCPVKIPLHQYLVEERSDLVRAGAVSKSEAALFQGFGFLTSHPLFYRGAVRSGRFFSAVIAEEGVLKKGPGLLAGWTKTRDLPIPAKESFHDWWRKRGEHHE